MSWYARGLMLRLSSFLAFTCVVYAVGHQYLQDESISHTKSDGKSCVVLNDYAEC